MKKNLTILLICLLFAVTTFAQESSQEDEEAANERRNRAAFNTRVDNLRNVGKNRIIRDRYKNTKTYQEVIKPIYRDPNEKELALLKPNEKFENQYSDFLKQKNTGLIKLVADKGCDEELNVIVSTPHCLKYKMPGAGSSYSFRTTNYRVKRLSDITFVNGNLSIKGVLIHGILVDLGNADINKLNAQSPGVVVLSGFTPPKKMEPARKLSYQLEKGIRGEKFTYSSSVKAKAGHTYALRSIAYKGNSYQEVNEITYDEFEFDKRRDVIIIFKILEADAESVSLIWKELKSKKTHKIKN